MKRWALLCFGILGCGGAATPAGQTPGAAGKHVAVATDELAERTDLANPALPPGTSLWGHVPSPDRDVPVIAALTNLGAFIDPKTLLEPKLGRELTAALDLRRPFDLLVFVGHGESDVRFAASIGIEDVPVFVAHTAKEFSLARLSAGRYRLVKKSGQEGFACEVWQASSAVGARLICATAEPLLELSGPFFASPERVNAKTANVHLEVPHEFIASMMRDLSKEAEEDPDTKESAAERAGEKLGRDEAIALFDSMQSVGLDVTLQEKSVELTEQIELDAPHGLLASLFMVRTGPHPTVPNAFWSLPPDSGLAYYGEGVDEDALRKEWRKLAPRLFEVGVDAKAAKPGQVEEFSRLVEQAFIHAGSWVCAYGEDLNATAAVVDDVAARLAAKPPKADAPPPPELVRASQKLGSWTLLGTQVGERDEIGAIRAVIAAGDKLPSKKDSESASEDRTHEKYHEKPLKHASQLPKGFVHLVIESVPNKKYVPKDGESRALPSTSHLIAVQQSGELWVVLSQDEEIAVQRLSQVLSPDPQRSLGSDAELKALALTPPAALGFFTTAGVIGAGVSLDSIAELDEARKSLSDLFSSPHRGATRVPLWLTAEGSSRRRISLHARIPADAIGDFLHLSLDGQ